MSSLSSAATGIYLGTDCISLGGGKFKVDKDGITTATSGIIGGWNITPDSMNRQLMSNMVDLSCISKLLIYSIARLYTYGRKKLRCHPTGAYLIYKIKLPYIT